MLIQYLLLFGSHPFASSSAFATARAIRSPLPCILYRYSCARLKPHDCGRDYRSARSVRYTSPRTSNRIPTHVSCYSVYARGWRGARLQTHPHILLGRLRARKDQFHGNTVVSVHTIGRPPLGAPDMIGQAFQPCCAAFFLAGSR